MVVPVFSVKVSIVVNVVTFGVNVSVIVKTIVSFVPVQFCGM